MVGGLGTRILRRRALSMGLLVFYLVLLFVVVNTAAAGALADARDACRDPSTHLDPAACRVVSR
jgi:hypothetical protein